MAARERGRSERAARAQGRRERSAAEPGPDQAVPEPSSAEGTVVAGHSQRTPETGLQARTTPAGGDEPAGGGGPVATSATEGGTAGRGQPTQGSRNRLGWIALGVAGVLTAWQVVYEITAPSVTNVEVYDSVGLLLTLVLAVGSMVLGIVALGQRVVPRWPAVAALAVGSFAFVVAVAAWIGRLMY